MNQQAPPVLKTPHSPNFQLKTRTIVHMINENSAYILHNDHSK